MRVIVALLLVFAVTPGMTEVVETAAHVVGHGDLPHHDDAESDPLGCDEHSCTPLFHACGCHAPMSAQIIFATGHAAAPADMTSTRLLPAMTVAGRAGEPPPLRPPIA